ncbi:MAG: MerR family transcriptional regulator [Actinobacteria bacterium]|jgi:AcrR family transcriptional regulator|nr:MAG: MerR family transcriptional regulator [Actinomycetota bacterium]
MDKQKYLTISELETLTGIPKSTIRYYAREGLISPHIKTGKTMAYYTEEQVDRLKLIKNLREEENMPIRFIVDELERYEAERQMPESKGVSIDRKQEIIQTTARLFTQKGYDKTSIQDIVSELQMSKSTFYIYFANKEELFIECTDYIFHQMFNQVWDSIRQEEDIIQRLIKRADAFFDAYPKWRDMMNQLRGIAVADNPAFMEKYKESLDYIVRPVIRDVERAVDRGILQEMNPEIIGFALMGFAEYTAELHWIFGKYDKQEVIDQVKKILLAMTRKD